MKRLNKTISLALVIVLMLTLLTQTASAANLPLLFDKSRVHRLDSFVATLQIGDMTFTGRFDNQELTDAKLEELVQKVLKDMGLDNAEFDKKVLIVDLMKSYDTITPAQAHEIYDRWLTILGAVPGAGQAIGTISTAVGAVQTVMQLCQGRFGAGAATGVTEGAKAGGALFLDAVEASSKGLIDKGVDTTGSVVGKYGMYGISVLQGVIAFGQGIYETWDEATRRTKARIAGYEAYRLIENFYSKLDSEIDSYYKDNKPVYAIVFENAKCEKPFTLYGVPCTETWTLNLTLFLEKAQPWLVDQFRINGEYGGDYVIDIEYDWGALVSFLPDLMRTSEWKINQTNFLEATLALFVEDDYPGNQKWTFPDPGSWVVKRTLEGKTKAIIEQYGKQTITPTQDSDQKSFSAPPVVVKMTGRVDGETGYFYGDGAEFCISADKDGFILGLDAVEMPKVYTVPFGDDVWKRGDNAKQGWILTLTPIGR